jgi:Cu-Zn family superoxide dismutase
MDTSENSAMKRSLTYSFGVAGLVVAALACGTSGGQEPAPGGPGKPVQVVVVSKAIAVLAPTKDSKVEGVVTFTQEATGIHVHAELSGLAPGKHGFHVHEFGNVSKDDGSACGGHFNPHGMAHGDATADPRHVGDLGNIEAGADGKAVYDRVDTKIAFSGMDSVIGRGLIVHEKVDDFGQPTGNAGGRIAQAVIGVAEIAK